MPITHLWTDSTLIAAAGSMVSPYFDLTGLDSIRISRNQTGGTYGLEIDWSRDGSAVDFIETVATVEDDQVSNPIAMRYGRVRIRNTGAGAFTEHRTTVTGA